MPQHKFDMTRAPPPPPDDGLTKAERLRRTATHPQMSWKEGTYSGLKMPAPRGDDPIILSKGLKT